MGGNDLREALMKLIKTDPKKREEDLAELLTNMQTNYQAIIERCKQICPNIKIVVMLQYTPGISPDVYSIYYLMLLMAQNKRYIPALTALDWVFYKLLGVSIKTEDRAVQQLHKLMTIAYDPIIAYAREQQIPVLDMATTFDQTQKNLFVRQIEPSYQGSALIAEMIANVIMNHNFNGPSLIYAKPSCNNIGPIIAINNENSWRPHTISKDHPQAIDYFYSEYYRQLNRDKTGISHVFGLFAKSQVTPNETLVELTEHAHSGGNRTLGVMQQLGWEKPEVSTSLKRPSSR